MCRRKRIWGKCIAFLLAASVLCQNLASIGSAETVKAADAEIAVSQDKITAKHADGCGAELAVDGDAGTFWQSMPSSGEGSGSERLYSRMYDHNRYIDITLDGTYRLSRIEIFNKVDGSYNHYYIYASSDGVNYNKIVSKTSDTPAEEEGDAYPVDVEASYIRLNMAYNSNSFATHLSEIKLYGAKINSTVPEPAEISVTPWEGSSWQIEWDKFEQDKAYANEKVLNEMSSLVERVIGSRWKNSFRFEFRKSLEDGKDIFEVKDGAGGTIVIRGNSGLAMACGFNYYLKNYVNVDYNPMYGSNTEFAQIVPVGKKIIREAQFDIRYALNFCTYSYTMSFWNWDEYEEFLDWAAMNGINLILDIVGQEEVLRETLLEFGYTSDEVKDYICGPAYFAWFYMQNLYSIGGPLPNAWFEQRTELGRRIHDRMQTYGIDPVIQAFAGQVPETFTQKKTDAVLTPVDEWPSFTRPSIIKTYLTEEESASGKHNYFPDMAQTFYEKQKNVYGDVSHYYAADPFHEGGKVGTLDVGTIYGEVQKELLKSDPKAVWVMQQWQGNLNAEKMSQLDASKTLPLDLFADMREDHGLFENLHAPWIWCMLHDFGGRMGLDGEIPVIASRPVEAFQSTEYMKGIGMTPEAMENSPVVYELLFDTNWSKDPIDYYAWLKQYAKRRAGGDSESLQKAWKILLKTAYADKNVVYQGAAETVINARPGDSFGSASTWGHSNILYDKKELDQALLLLAQNYEAFSKSPAYKYDLADVAEQVLCNAAVEYHKLMVQAKNERKLEEFTELSNTFLGLIDLSDRILSTTDEFMLGTWIEAARKMIDGADDWTKDLFEFNARVLVTTWGGERSSALKDYSNRKWAGLTKDFYRERWAVWIRNRTAELKGETKDPADVKAESNWFMWEWQWAQRKSDDEDGRFAFETKPSDANLGNLARQAFELYSVSSMDVTAQKTVNIAKGKTVSSQSETLSGALSNITDGTTATEWAAKGEGPHTIEIDLAGTYRVNSINIAVPQLAKDFPYTYKVEYYDMENASWTLVEERTEGSMESNTMITEKFTSSKIRFTMSTRDTVDSPLTITEITVDGAETEGGASSYENLAAGITPTAVNKNNESVGGTIGNLTDGNPSTLWAAGAWGSNDNYPVKVEVDLQQSLYVDALEVYFEKTGLPFEFTVSVIDADGQETVVSDEFGSHDNVLAESRYQIKVEKEIQKASVTLKRNTGKGSFPGVWPALAEFMVMGGRGASFESNVNLSGTPVSGITVSGGGATAKTLDGNKDTFDKVTENEEITFDLGWERDISYVDLTFEKGDLGLRYQVLSEDASGNRTMLSDKSGSSGMLGDRTVHVPVNREAKKIIFIHMGNNGSGPSYAAERRLYEFEAYEVEKLSGGITVEPKNAAGLLNGTGYTAGKDPVVLTFEEPIDVTLIKVMPALDETKALKYMAEYQDAETGEWKVFADLTEVRTASSVSLAVPEADAYTQKIRLTFKETAELSAILLYKTDYAGMLLKTVAPIEQLLSQITVGDRNGNYSEEAANRLWAVLDELKAVTGVNSKTIQPWLYKAESALDEFYETGRIYLERSELLNVMAEAQELLGMYESDELQAVYDEARALYQTYNMGQSDINMAKNRLTDQVLAIGAELEAVNNPELSEAKKENQEFLDNLEEKNETEYTQESWKNYMDAYDELQIILGEWNTSEEAIAAAKNKLEQAMQALKKTESVKPPENGGESSGSPSGVITNPDAGNPAKELPQKNYIHKTTTLEYVITESTDAVKTAAVRKSLKKNASKIKIPASIKIEGYDYKVTEIKAKAFRKNKKIKQVTIGSNIKIIGKEAFFGCSKLKTVQIASQGITKIEKKAFGSIYKKAKITVPKKKYSSYAKLLKKAKTAKTVQLKKKK